MGFPSPAADYLEDRLSINTICNITANSLVIETANGYAVIDKSMRPRHGDTVLVTYDGGCTFAIVRVRTLITEDGVLEGDALDDVMVHGVLTHSVLTFKRDDTPV